MTFVRARVAMVLAVAAVAALTLPVRGDAATLEATWSLFGRANTTSFAPGAALPTPPAGPVGWEIVGFAAAGPSDGIDSFHYGGADLPAEHSGPVPAIVTCDATFTATAMSITVQGAYPYAGCIFFLGVSNTGDVDLRVDLGPLDSRAVVECTNPPGCSKADVDIVAGGPDLAAIATLCRTDNGTAIRGDGLTYTVPPGATFVCPLFVTVLQSAREDTTYIVTFVPPTDIIAGAKTPGTTPLAPATGNGTLVQRATRNGGHGVVGLIILVAATSALIIAVPANRRRS